jgi:hypothetical protein
MSCWQTSTRTVLSLSVMKNETVPKATLIALCTTVSTGHKVRDWRWLIAQLR